MSETYSQHLYSGLMDPSPSSSQSTPPYTQHVEDADTALLPRTKHSGTVSVRRTTSANCEQRPMWHISSQSGEDDFVVNLFWKRMREAGYDREWFTTAHQLALFHDHEELVQPFVRKKIGILMLLEAQKTKLVCRECLAQANRLTRLVNRFETQLLDHYIALSHQYWEKLPQVSSPGPLLVRPPCLPKRCDGWISYAKAWCKVFHQKSNDPMALLVRTNARHSSKEVLAERLFTERQVEARS